MVLKRLLASSRQLMIAKFLLKIRFSFASIFSGSIFLNVVSLSILYFSLFQFFCIVSMSKSISFLNNLLYASMGSLQPCCSHSSSKYLNFYLVISFYIHYYPWFLWSGSLPFDGQNFNMVGLLFFPAGNPFVVYLLKYSCIRSNSQSRSLALGSLPL